MTDPEPKNPQQKLVVEKITDALPHPATARRGRNGLTPGAHGLTPQGERSPLPLGERAGVRGAVPVLCTNT